MSFIFLLFSLYSGVVQSCEKKTLRLVPFGISTPTASRPGMGATIRIDVAFIDMAISFSKAVMRFTFTPGQGCTS